MKTNSGKDICYNVQVSVDNKNKLILDYEATSDCTDQNQLSPMCERAKKTLEVEKIEATLDTGYFNAVQIKECEDNGTTLYIPETPKHNGIVPQKSN